MAANKKPIEFSVLSHKGLIRENNEDYAAVQEINSVGHNKALLAVLADGVGGHNAGEVASRIAVDTIFSSVNNTDSSDPHAVLESAIITANQAILENVENHPDRIGMGTTCVCGLIVDQTLFTAHLGDSRLYILRKGLLSRLTKDHTLFEEYKNLSILHPGGDSRSHPMSHILSRYLGSTHTIDVDHQMIGIAEGNHSLTLKSGDILLLCSDGVSDLLTEDEIVHILQACVGRKCAQLLVFRALEKGGHDNATVIVLKIP